MNAEDADKRYSSVWAPSRLIVDGEIRRKEIKAHSFGGVQHQTRHFLTLAAVLKQLEPTLHVGYIVSLEFNIWFSSDLARLPSVSAQSTWHCWGCCVPLSLR